MQEILDLIFDNYLCHFETDWQPDISTIRKKLKEYVSLGILTAEKRGRELYYRRSEDSIDLAKTHFEKGTYSNLLRKRR